MYKYAGVYNRILTGIKRHPWRVGLKSMLMGVPVATGASLTALIRRRREIANLAPRALFGDPEAVRRLRALTARSVGTGLGAGLGSSLISAGIYGYRAGAPETRAISRILHNRAALAGGLGVAGLGGLGAYAYSRHHKKHKR